MGEVVNVEEILPEGKRDLKIEEITELLRKEEQVDLGEQNLFADGMLCRHGMMPKGSIIIGLVHKKTAINVLSQGSMLIKLKMEDEWERVDAPFINSTGAGVRKIIYTLEDCYFMNIFREEETELDVLYDKLCYLEEGSKPYLEAQEFKKKRLKDQKC